MCDCSSCDGKDFSTEYKIYEKAGYVTNMQDGLSAGVRYALHDHFALHAQSSFNMSSLSSFSVLRLVLSANVLCTLLEKTTGL